MAKYKRLISGYYMQRYQYLIKAGFENWEAREIVYGGNYSTFRRNKALGNSDPAIYLQRAIKARILYIGNLQRRGYSAEQIHLAIAKLYERKGWTTAPKGFVGVGERRDPFQMIRDFRKASIESGDYRRPPKKGSHHSKLKRSDVQAQKKHRAQKDNFRKYTGSWDDGFWG